MTDSSFDFCGYATKNDVRCYDGLTIRHNAFAGNHGSIVPLVWQHGHNDPNNVLGHVKLENRKDGVYAYGFFNDSDSARTAKQLLTHGDINAMSICANRLSKKKTETGADVVHGNIVEVSLVLSGANPGALIDTISFQHADGEEVGEAIIYTDDELSMTDTPEEAEHSDESKDVSDGSNQETVSHADKTPVEDEPSTTTSKKEAPVAEKTVQDVFNEFTEEQKNVVYFLIGQALEEAGVGDDDDDDMEGAPMSHSSGNIFEDGYMAADNDDRELAHSAFAEAISDAKSRRLDSFREAFLEHAGTYGIDNIDILFPDAQLTGDPSFIKRDDSWVNGVLNGAKHSPFARIKTVHADITADQARARGYIKGRLKKDEVFRLLKRVTTPTTIYKKQKLDRDDVVDITDLDVVAWMKGEMRGMLDEELARCVLVGDGRDSVSEEKISEEHIRPIWKDSDLYAPKVLLDADATTDQIVDAIVLGFENYEGKGIPTFYTTRQMATAMLTLKDKIGRRLYDTKEALAAALGVKAVVEVPVMNGLKRHDDGTNTDISLVGIVVNMPDYTIGSDKGGSVSLFDDFDIDYNTYKYLIETRASGALTVPKSAIIIEKKMKKIAGAGAGVGG